MLVTFRVPYEQAGLGVIGLMTYDAYKISHLTSHCKFREPKAFVGTFFKL